MEANRVLSATQLDCGQWAALADAEQALEESWHSGEAPELGRLLPPADDPSRVRVLVELIKVDQEFRFKNGQQKPLEAYLQEWDELRASPELVRELLEAECLTRATLAAAPTAEELRTRFPEIATSIDLDRIKAAAESELTPASPALATETSRGSLEHTPSQEGLPAPLPVGERFGRYEIRALLGHGAMGCVYRAYDTRLECEVALKTPQFDPVREPDVGERFLREAQAAAKSRHPHVCPIYDAGQIGNTLYIAMALIEGQTLAERMRGRQMEPRDAAELIGKLARALESVHRAGIVHRDVKPHNVMIDRSGEPILMDFGLAREAGPEGPLSASGSIEGAPAYMSPEQVEGRPADARSDVYGLGVVLYQLLTAQLPFSGSLTQVLAAIPTSEPPAPRSLRPAIDAAIETICLKAMAKHPSDRYQSAEELAEALHAYLEGTLPAPTPPRGKHKWWVAAAAAGGLVLLGVIVKITIEISSTSASGLGFDVAWSVQGDKVLVGDVNGDGKPEVVVGTEPSFQVYDAAGKAIGEPIRDAGDLNILAVVDKSRLPRIITWERVPDPAERLSENDKPQETPLRLHVYADNGQLLKTLETKGQIWPLRLGYRQVPTIRACLATDLDRDGNVELVACVAHEGGRYTRGIVVFDYESGKERWHYWTGPMPRDVQAAGFRGNALLDIVLAGIGPNNRVQREGDPPVQGEDTVDGRCYVFRLNGATGKPVWIRRFEPEDRDDCHVYSSVAVADVDADGRLDIVAASWMNEHRRQGADLVYDPSQDLGRLYVLNAADGKTRPGYERNFGCMVEIASVADFDGDGRPEILVSVRDEKTRLGSLVMLRGGPGLPEVCSYSLAERWFKLTATGDVDGDGHPEVVAVASPSAIGPQTRDTIYILSHILDPTPLWEWKAGGFVDGVTVSDLDGDGASELIVTHGGRVSVLRRPSQVPQRH